MKKNNRRGFTLAELTVVLAVLVIVSAMVVSFTAMVSNSRQLSTARLEALGDVRVAETLIENFIEGNADVKVIDDNTLTAGESTLLLDENGNLVIGNGGSITLERVKSITFEYYGNNTDEYYGNNTDGIYYCTVVYTVGDKDFNYIFCVNPYVGEGGN
ncbi:MAG: type II secretion system protein [Clostridia bacterium]|nr:type II secretion system protein [Clostridia bacterium]